MAGTGKKAKRKRSDIQVPIVSGADSAPAAAPCQDDEPFPFTPECVLDGVRCIARVWGNGAGGQCTKSALRDGHCRLHLQACSHGDVNGPIPVKKLKEFQRAAKRVPAREDEDIPDDVRAELERMVTEGMLPRTTSEQRKRQKLSRGSEYGVPPNLKNALKWGYISPNLPAPTGMQWRARGGRWSLLPRGG